MEYSLITHMLYTCSCIILCVLVVFALVCVAKYNEDLDSNELLKWGVEKLSWRQWWSGFKVWMVTKSPNIVTLINGHLEFCYFHKSTEINVQIDCFGKIYCARYGFGDREGFEERWGRTTFWRLRKVFKEKGFT